MGSHWQPQAAMAYHGLTLKGAKGPDLTEGTEDQPWT